MTTIFERTAAALATLAPVPYAMGTYLSPSPESLPSLFMTYKVISGPPEQHADDDETLRSYRVQVSIFSRDDLVNLPNVDGAMKAVGFMPAGMRQLEYDERTRHHGLAKDFTYLEDL